MPLFLFVTPNPTSNPLPTQPPNIKNQNMVDNIECDANVFEQYFVPCTGYGDTYEYDNSDKNDSCKGVIIPQAYHCAPTNRGQCQEINKSDGDDIVYACNNTDGCEWQPVEPPPSIVTDCGTLSDETSCNEAYLNEQAETYSGIQYPNFHPVCAWVDDKCVRGDNSSNFISAMCYDP